MTLTSVEEFMAANPRHSTVVHLRTGVKRDGTLTAHHAQFLVNCGAYAGYKPGRTIGGANRTAGPYRIPNTLIESSHVYTNIVPGGHMRGPGFPQAIFALESHMDEVAKQLDMDPVEFRLKNVVDEGEEAAMGSRLTDVRVKETLQAAAKAIGHGSPKPPNVGRGFAIGDHPPGGGQGTASVTLQPDGTVLLGTPIFDQGTGTYTTLGQVVAEELSLPPERVKVEVWNTDAIEFDSGIGGSRGTRVATSVANAAAGDAKQNLVKLAASQLEWPEEKIELQGEELHRTDTDETVTWPELLARSQTTVTGQANVNERGSTPQTSFVAQAAEVSVDPETGEVTILRFVTAHDVGRILNPVGHQGQINGGFMQGLGYALMEDLRLEDGHVTALSFGDYKIPTIKDIPPLETVLLESEAGAGPYQVRGIGENSTPAVAPAIANAIADAIGVRVRNLPITSEKVYNALKAPGNSR
jgi:CO/xanthine dehydrogenase Mo-binding subunit